MYFLLAFSLHSETYAKLVIIMKVIKSPISSTSLFCAIIISKEVIIMKKDIDFDKIAKETLDELTKNFKTEDVFKEIGFKIADISTKTVKLMLKKYHQELLED